MTQVLIVDDREEDLCQFRALLVSSGYEVCLAADGAEALALARLNPPDLIIADILMPVMDGFTLCRQWKNDPQLRSLPFLFYSATYTEPRDVEAALSLGADAFIVKPQAPDMLLKLIREALQRCQGQAGEPKNDVPPKGADPVRVREYNEVLIRELENRIVALQEANQALRSSEARFRLLAENASDMVFRLSLPERSYDYVSPAAGKITGYAPDEFYQLPGLLEQIVHPDWRQYFREQWSRVLAGENRIFCEYQIIHQSGRTKWVHQRNTVIRGSAGQPEAIEGIVSDITRRKQQELLLRKEHRFREAVIERAGEGLCVWHETGEFPFLRFTVWNRRMSEITGYTMEEINRLGWFQAICLDPEIQARARQRMTNVLRGEDIHGETWEITRADGEKRQVSMSTSVLTTADGITHVLALMLDITEERRALAELEETRHRWEDIFHAIGHPTLILDASHNIIMANRATLTVTGMAREEILGKKCYDVFHPSQHQPPEGCPLEKQLTSGRLEKVEMEVEALGGIFLVSCTPMINASGVVDHVIHIATDITERKRAEEHLEREKEKYRILTEESPVGVALIGNDGEYKYLNPKFVEMFGYTPAEIPVGSDWFERAFPEPKSRQEAVLAWIEDLKAAQVGEVRPRTFSVTCKDGSRKLVNFRPVSLQTGDQLVIYEDLTELAQVADALREREETLRALIDSNPESLLLLDSQGVILAANQTVARRLGKRLEELQEVKIFDVLPPEVAAGRKAHLGEVVAAGKPVRFEDLHQGRPIESYYYPIFDSQGQVSGIACLEMDLTERKQAEELLRKSEQRYRMLVHSIPALVFTGYVDGSVDFFDEKVACLTGFHVAEFHDRRIKWLDLIMEEDRAVAKEVFRQAMQGTGSYVREYRIKTKDEGVCWIQERSQIVRHPDGQVDNISGVFFDITAHKRLEEERDRLFTLSLDMLCVAGFDGFFKQLNPAWNKTLGWSEAALFSRPYVDFVHPDDRPGTVAAGERLREGHPVFQFENRYQCLDGSYRWLSWNSFPFPEEDLIFAVARDVTERRQLEAQFLQAQKMEAVGRLAGGVAHDFNNLLTVIVGNLDLTMLQLHPGDPLRHYLERIRAAADRATSLTQQLLAFSRKQLLQPKLLNLNEVVANLERMLRRIMGEDIEWLTVLEPSLGSVLADPGQIESVLMNLAVNARDAMPHGGKLTIETANVDLDEMFSREYAEVIPGHYAKLSVSDTGMGMDEATRAQIFEPFFTTKELGRGTGLGLSTVYGIVKQSGGHIFVHSELGHGSTFELYFPRLHKGAEPLKKTESLPFPLPRGTETILVVEDDSVLREIILEILQRFGYTILVARHGEEAFSLAQHHSGSIHLLLTDVVMPYLSGPELAARLTRLRREMKVLYMSGYADDPTVHQKVLEVGQPFLLKPFELQTLVIQVREVLDGA